MSKEEREFIASSLATSVFEHFFEVAESIALRQFQSIKHDSDEQEALRLIRNINANRETIMQLKQFASRGSNRNQVQTITDM